MNILVTGAKGFAGKNLVENLKNIRDGKNMTRHIQIDEIFEYDIDTDTAISFCPKRFYRLRKSTKISVLSCFLHHCRQH